MNAAAGRDRVPARDSGGGVSAGGLGGRLRRR